MKTREQIGVKTKRCPAILFVAVWALAAWATALTGAGLGDARAADNPYCGGWALTLPGGWPAWLGVEEDQGRLKASLDGRHLRAAACTQARRWQVGHEPKTLRSKSMGGVCSRITPAVAAEKPSGVWQTLDITLVDRHVTVILNGTKTIDNQPVPGCTPWALWGDVTRPGPIYLRGDKTSVEYRNLILRPVRK